MFLVVTQHSRYLISQIKNKRLLSTTLALRHRMTTKRTLEQKLSCYVPTQIRSDNSHLSENQKNALNILVQAAKCMDEIYMEQKWAGNKKLFEDLKKDTSENGKKLARYFWINRCPWSM